MADTINKDETRERLLNKKTGIGFRRCERTAQTFELRQLPEATVKEIVGSGMFRALRPAKWGGYEFDPVDFYKIKMILAEACMATAWVYINSW